MKNRYLKYFILSMAVVFVYVGVNRDENLEVLRKAINICLECIGIG